MNLLALHPGGVWLDATLGGGGCARTILEQTTPDGTLIGLDQDDRAIETVRASLASFGARCRLVQENFAGITDILDRLGVDKLDGCIADFGLSSDQLDDPDRGFSFSHPGPLDMRMDRTRGETLEEWLQGVDETSLANVLYELGGEKFRGRIAKAILKAARNHQLRDTADLAKVVQDAIPARHRERRIHPATRTFQALRIAVNRELESIEVLLRGAIDRLKVGGRLVVISFHSGEDRLAKQVFRESSRKRYVGEPPHQTRVEPITRLLTRKPIRPSEEETDRNPRARSARLRAVERLPEIEPDTE